VRPRISAFVVSYNRAPLIGTCLRALSFADEVIVVDKSSTDDTPAIAARHADRVITVPWSPTVEETRAFAASQCTHDWILYLDDDECLSPEAVRFIEAEVAAPRADIYGLPQRHYILGVHNENAYYWPEYQTRLFRRDAVAFSATVHAGIVLRSNRVLNIAPETGVAIHHLSHLNVAQWIEKANRYTARADRVRVEHDGQDLIRFAHQRIDHWQARTRAAEPGGYAEAVAVLRATYDLVDRLKTWEEERGLDAAAQFRQVCAELDAAYAALTAARPETGARRSAKGPTPMAACEQMAPTGPASHDEADALRARVAAFRTRHDSLTAERDALAAATASRAAELQRLTLQLSNLQDALDAARREIDAERHRAEVGKASYTQALAESRAEALEQKRRADAIEASTFWRATVIPRRLAERFRRLFELLTWSPVTPLA
jgi:hypothetical protein